jgi:hypothetical protein
MWFHQHFNGSAEPVFFLAIGWGSDKPKAGGKAYVYKSVKEDGEKVIGSRARRLQRPACKLSL